MRVVFYGFLRRNNLIRDYYHEEVDLAQLPPGDPAVYDALQHADTVGWFQVESRAQMSCKPRMKCANWYDIVVQVAIIRPGPIVGTMIHPYFVVARETRSLPACIRFLRQC